MLDIAFQIWRNRYQPKYIYIHTHIFLNPQDAQILRSEKVYFQNGRRVAKKDWEVVAVDFPSLPAACRTSTKSIMWTMGKWPFSRGNMGKYGETWEDEVLIHGLLGWGYQTLSDKSVMSGHQRTMFLVGFGSEIGYPFLDPHEASNGVVKKRSHYEKLPQHDGPHIYVV